MDATRIGAYTLAHPARPLAEGIGFIEECRVSRTGIAYDPPWATYEPGDEIHNAVVCYLLQGEKSLLFDTCSPIVGDHVVAEVERCLDGDPLDYVVLSHGEAPHSGNLGALRRAFPEATLVASDHASPEHAMFEWDAVTLVEPGDVIDLGGLEAEIVEALVPDTAMSLWLFERTRRALFTVDWLGAVHTEHECALTASELSPPSTITAERLYENQSFILPWMRYMQPERIEAVVEHVIDRFDPAYLAPAHGIPIDEDPVGHLRRMAAAMQRMVAEAEA